MHLPERPDSNCLQCRVIELARILSSHPTSILSPGLYATIPIYALNRIDVGFGPFPSESHE